MGIWLAADISLNRKLDHSRRNRMVTFLDSGSAKPLATQKRTGRSNQTFRPNRRALTEARAASIGERTTDATPRAASKPPP